MSASPAAAAAPAPTFGDPTPLGLFGLSIACAALLPIAFGVKEALTPEALRTASWFCLLFGAACQFLAGMMSFANKNMLGGTLLTTFSFNWVMNWWALSELSQGRVPSSSIILAVDVCFLLVFFVMTYAFGFFSRLLFVFLLDIDLLYILRITKEVLHVPALGLGIALSTVALMGISLYIAFSLVLANASGRMILPIGGPIFTPKAPEALGRARGRGLNRQDAKDAKRGRHTDLRSDLRSWRPLAPWRFNFLDRDSPADLESVRGP
jgi:succinate-acetate transporter protein